MRLDERIVVGSVVLVRRQFEAEVVGIAEDRRSCSVVYRSPVPAQEEDDAEADREEAPARPPELVVWSEVKLRESHL